MEITVSCPQMGELAQAIGKLAVAMSQGNIQDNQITTGASNPVAPPAQTTAIDNPTIPIQPVTPPVQPAPASDLSYSLEQLGQAAAPLMAAGKQPQLTAMLQEFGVLSLSELPIATYPAVANKLRELGAKI